MRARYSHRLIRALSRLIRSLRSVSQQILKESLRERSDDTTVAEEDCAVRPCGPFGPHE